ncbi:hypothetical protein B0T10DRAFT_564459 [Thelonectria olida]|uniref:PPPDE domain-containing protein n=1 Tax=Thelonectria olida TaxID=1576542 RepID=A0A9P8VZ01_9HYPO|nr:hypothetical protein B0T10DRAFT_564459 [Thelonectria olida]
MGSSNVVIVVTAVLCSFAAIVLVIAAVKWPPWKSTARLSLSLQRSLDAGVENAKQRYLQQETSAGEGDEGEAVWFSHHVHSGQLRHWVLITHDSKYEIRRPRSFANFNVDMEGDSADNAGWTAVGTSEAQYEYRIQPCTINTEQVATATVDFSGLPSTDNLHTTGTIGWTDLSKDEVDTAWIAMLEKLGDYDILWNNCQHVLRDFASLITRKKADDWDQFIIQASLSHQRRLHGKPIGPDLVAVMASLERLKAILPQVEGDDKRSVESNIKHVEKRFQEQQKNLAMSHPIDLADASNLSRSQAAQKTSTAESEEDMEGFWGKYNEVTQTVGNFLGISPDSNN